MKKIKEALNNENGGPNLEHLLLISLSLSTMVAVFLILNSLKNFQETTFTKIKDMDDSFK